MSDLTDSERHTLARWRLVLGKSAEQHGISCGDDEGCAAVAPLIGYLFGDDGESLGLGPAQGGLGKSQTRRGGKGRTQLTVPNWVDQVTELFPNKAREVLEKELIQRRGLDSILKEPKLLEKVEPNVDIVKTLLTHKHLLNPETRILGKNAFAGRAGDYRRNQTRSSFAASGLPKSGSENNNQTQSA
jgi:hypothetical protein